MKKFILLLAVLVSSLCAFSQRINPDIFKELDFRFIGPEGNRTIAVAGVPGDNNIAYIGAASGGLWRTRDYGDSWELSMNLDPNNSSDYLEIIEDNKSAIEVYLEYRSNYVMNENALCHL